MSEYRLLIAQEVLDFLDGLPRRERLKLRNRFLQIADAPGLSPSSRNGTAWTARWMSTSAATTR